MEQIHNNGGELFGTWTAPMFSCHSDAACACFECAPRLVQHGVPGALCGRRARARKLRPALCGEALRGIRGASRFCTGFHIKHARASQEGKRPPRVEALARSAWVGVARARGGCRVRLLWLIAHGKRRAGETGAVVRAAFWFVSFCRKSRKRQRPPRGQRRLPIPIETRSAGIVPSPVSVLV